MAYISKQGLYNLRYYRYTGVDKSLMVKYFLKRHWEWVLETFVPLWIAPNLLTLLGFGICSLAMGAVLFFAPTGMGPLPTWVYVLVAISMYLYQVLDNIDGKQARRTGTSSALGELFDHGVDSIVCFLFAIWIANVNGASDGWGMYFTVWAAAMPWWLSHWEEMHTGVLVLGEIGNPTEAQWFCIGMVLARAFGGQALYSTVDALIASYTGHHWMGMNFAISCLVWIAGSPMIVLNTKEVLSHTNDVVRSFMILLPMVLCGGLSTLWFAISPMDMLNRYPIVCIMFVCLMFSHIVNRMLISRITRTPFDSLSPLFFLPAIGILNEWFPMVHVNVMFWSLMIATLAIYVHFVLSVIGQLKTHLGIDALCIPYTSSSSSSSS